MNAMMMQLSHGLIECRERAQVVGISNPEHVSGSSSSAGALPIVIVVLAVVVIALIAVVVVLALKSRSSKAAIGRTVMPANSTRAVSRQPSVATAPCVSCGAPVSRTSKFCPTCGTRQN